MLRDAGPSWSDKNPENGVLETAGSRGLFSDWEEILRGREKVSVFRPRSMKRLRGVAGRRE